MPDFLTLHRRRQEIGLKRQPEFVADLTELQLAVEELGFDHPYDYSQKLIDRLKVNKHFSAGCRGPQTPASSCTFLYRIGSVGQILNSALWKGPTYEDPYCPKKTDTPGRIYKYLKSISAGDWLPLTRFASGMFTNERSFTWWTESLILEEKWVGAAYRLGMVYEWLSPYPLLLRCKPSARLAMHIPTSIDGFVSPIFDPSRLADDPKHGLAIDITSPAALTKGHKEFILGPVDVSTIEVLPVNLPEPDGSEIFLDDYLANQLALYCED